jgi:hypothetical protein
MHIDQREPYADFVSPFAFDSFRMVARAESVKSANSGVFFLSSFSVGVWGGIVSLIVLHLVVSLFDMKFATLLSNVGDPGTEDNSYAYDEVSEAKRFRRSLVRLFQRVTRQRLVYR